MYCDFNYGGMCVSIRFLLHAYLQYNEIGGSCVQVLSNKTLLKQILGVSHSSEQVIPQGVLCLPGTVYNGLKEERELCDELSHSGQQWVGDGLPWCRLFFQNNMHHQLHHVGEVREGGAWLGQHQSLWEEHHEGGSKQNQSHQLNLRLCLCIDSSHTQPHFNKLRGRTSTRTCSPRLRTSSCLRMWWR